MINRQEDKRQRILSYASAVSSTDRPKSLNPLHLRGVSTTNGHWLNHWGTKRVLRLANKMVSGNWEEGGGVRIEKSWRGIVAWPVSFPLTYSLSRRKGTLRYSSIKANQAMCCLETMHYILVQGWVSVLFWAIMSRSHLFLARCFSLVVDFSVFFNCTWVLFTFSVFTFPLSTRIRQTCILCC